jgi:hypothetical protein
VLNSITPITAEKYLWEMPINQVVVMIAAKLKFVDGKNDIGVEMSSETSKEFFGLLDNSPEAVEARRKQMQELTKKRKK